MATERTSSTPDHQATDRLAKAAHEAVDRAAARGAQAEERLRRTGDYYSDQSRQAFDRLGGYINAHPYAAVGWAVVGGFVIGRLLGRR